MEADRGITRPMVLAWTGAVIVFLYLPAVCLALASLTASRYFTFPIPKWGTEWWGKTLNSFEIRQLLSTSISIAAVVTVIAVVLAFFGALAFARYVWKGRALYQKLVLLPIPSLVGSKIVAPRPSPRKGCAFFWPNS